MRLRRHRVAAGLAAFVIVGLGFSGWLGLGPRSRTADIGAGRQLYLEHCASCHGANLEGQPGWRTALPSGRMPAPPHDATGHTWHHADADLFSLVKHGLGAIVPGYESDMPAFAGVLTDDEIRAVIDYIKSTWPDRERAYQAERSAAAAKRT